MANYTKTVSVHVSAHVRACVRAYVRACVRACMSVWVEHIHIHELILYQGASSSHYLVIKFLR